MGRWERERIFTDVKVGRLVITLYRMAQGKGGPFLVPTPLRVLLVVRKHEVLCYIRRVILLLLKNVGHRFKDCAGSGLHRQRSREMRGYFFVHHSVYKGPVRTFDRMACFHSETSHLMLYREMAWGSLYDSYSTHKYTVWAKWKEFNAKLDGTYINALNEVE